MRWRVLASFLLLAACSTWHSVAPGVEYRKIRAESGEVHVARIELDDSRVRLLASDQSDRGATVSAFAATHETVVAINGDYFDQQSNPVGLAVGSCGTWRTGAGAPRREPYVALRGSAARIEPPPEVVPEGLGGAVSGWPMIVENCRALGRGELKGSESFAWALHPRTAVGFSRDGRRMFLVAVDGRSEFGTGMTLAQLATFMREKLGVCAALNLDGGGSTEMVVRGRIVNHPSDGKERPVGNHLGVAPSTVRPRCP